MIKVSHVEKSLDFVKVERLFNKYEYRAYHDQIKVKEDLESLLEKINHDRFLLERIVERYKHHFPENDIELWTEKMGLNLSLREEHYAHFLSFCSGFFSCFNKKE